MKTGNPISGEGARKDSGPKTMNLPSSEPLPNDINELPPARQRHIRRQPRSASLAERQLLLESLLDLTAPTLTFILLSMIGAAAVGAALYFDDPAILVLACVLFPFLTPILSFSLLPITQKFSHATKSLLILAILLMLTFGAGIFAGYQQKTITLQNIDLFRFSGLYWVDLTIVGLSALFGVLIFQRQGKLPRLIGVLLAYEILVPIAVAGFGFPLGSAQLWPSALLVGITHFGIACVVGVFAFLVFGFNPKKTLGWFLALTPVILTLALFALSLNMQINRAQPEGQGLNISIPSPAPTHTPSSRTTKKALTSSTEETATLSPTNTTLPSATTTKTPTDTPTPSPTTFWGVINSPSGTVIRESPSYDSLVVGYTNFGDPIEVLEQYTHIDATIWYRVRNATGDVGWLSSVLVETQTPTPSPTPE